jgi:hypothetical protein
VPQPLIEKEVKAYKGTGVVDFKAFRHRSHFICNQEGWDEVADSRSIGRKSTHPDGPARRQARE